jgi:hypothetical protein
MWNRIHHIKIQSWNPPMHVVACFPVYSGVTKPCSVFPNPTRDFDLREREGFCEQRRRGLAQRKIAVSRLPRLGIARKQERI